MASLKNETTQLKSDMAKLENDRKESESKLQAEKKESSYWESKTSEFETDLQVRFNIEYELKICIYL